MFYNPSIKLYIEITRLLYNILYNRNTLALDEVYDVLFSKEKIKHLVVGFKARAEGLIVQGRTHDKTSIGNVTDKTCRYYKKIGQIKFACCKLHNKNNKATNHKGKQPKITVKQVLRKVITMIETS